MNNNVQEKEYILTPNRMISFFAAILTLWVLAAFGIPFYSFLFDIGLDKFANWGDSLGAVGTLFSALALIAVLASLREQQEEIRGMRLEALERRTKELRAATPVIEVAEGLKGSSDKHVTYKLRNIGETIFDVRWVADDQSILIWDAPSIIGRGSVFTIKLESQRGNGDQHLDFHSRKPFKIHMFCVDCTGNVRNLVYLCSPSKYKGFECIDHGLGSLCDEEGTVKHLIGG